MVPHVAARKTHRRSLEFSFNTPKRLLQQNRHQTDTATRLAKVRYAITSEVGQRSAELSSYASLQIGETLFDKL
jgi:hypothetical protein